MTDSPPPSAIPFDCVGFDLDGTLLDTSGELAAAVNAALASIDRAPLPPEDVRPMIGLGARHMLDVGLEASGGSSDELVERCFPVLLHHYEAHLGSDSPPFPGLIAAMDALAERDIALAVVTNKYEHLAQKLLDAVGLAPRFAAIIGGDTMGKGKAKPNPAPIEEMMRRAGAERAAFVGDSIYDVEAARGAGAATVAVSFGFLHQPVEELGADAVIDHYDALLPTLRALGRLPAE